MYKFWSSCKSRACGVRGSGRLEKQVGRERGSIYRRLSNESDLCF